MEYIFSVFGFFTRFLGKKPDLSDVKIDQGIIQDLQTISGHFHMTPKVVYYPSCGNNISPQVAFPKARVYFVDKNKQIAKALLKGGMKYVYSRTSEHFKIPIYADFTLLIDSRFEEQALKNTQKNGLIISNDHYGAASILYLRKEIELVGVLTSDGVDDDFLDDYFQSAKTDADLKRAGVYQLYRKSVERVDPKIEDVMSFIRKDYQKIMGTDTYLGVALSVAKGDVDKMLPKKRGVIDSASGFGVISNLCIFRKK